MFGLRPKYQLDDCENVIPIESQEFHSLETLKHLPTGTKVSVFREMVDGRGYLHLFILLNTEDGEPFAMELNNEDGGVPLMKFERAEAVILRGRTQTQGNQIRLRTHGHFLGQRGFSSLTMIYRYGYVFQSISIYFSSG